MTRSATLRRSFPTLMLLAAPLLWVGKSRRRILGAALIVLAIIASLPLWWVIQLVGLPDIGDPFDVAAFRALTIPDERNAYLLYGQAAQRLKPGAPRATPAGGQVDWLVSWSKLIPDARQWANENREALAIYRRGSELPDALGAVPKFQGDHQDLWGMSVSLQYFEILALLEGSRLEEQGDMAGAWGWYRAALRTIHHVGMHGTVFRRGVVQRWHMQLSSRLAGWAADRRTTPALLRQAVDDVAACEALDPVESYTLKAEYLDVDRLLDDPDGPTLRQTGSWSMPIPFLDIHLTPDQTQSLYDAWRFWLREPERSRRVIRLAIANWLAYGELPAKNRPSPARGALGIVDFYLPCPEAPANARTVSPQALARWLNSSIDANFLLGSWGWKLVRWQERSNHRALLILLGQELYCRDFGTNPPTPEVLVGPYLKSLPAEFPDNGRDETIPASDSSQRRTDPG
jgi:hypothetical protein